MSHLKEGDKAPAFSAPDQYGNKISLSNFSGKKLILYFYPKDNTPGCTMQACNYRDNYEDLIKEGYQIVGVSADTEKKHQNFIDKYNLPFSLIADTEKEVINAYGVWGQKKFMGREFMGIKRMTFIINEDGIIEKIIEKSKTKNASDQIREVMEQN